MKSFVIPTLAAAALGLAAGFASEPPPPTAWERLLEGNARFVAGQPEHPHQDAARRAETAEVQKPFAIVIGCADSRTSPEVLFDQGLGDLFVVRLAGNLIDELALGSIEFAVGQLGARLIVVLGHERCGAVNAAVEAVRNGAGQAPGQIGAILRALQPAAASVQGQAGDLVDHAVKANVKLVTERLKTISPILTPLFQSGELEIVGARYDLDEGTVTEVP